MVDDNVLSFEEGKYSIERMREVAGILEPIAGDMVVWILPPDLIEEFVEVVHLQAQMDICIDILKDRVANRSVHIVRESLDHTIDVAQMARDMQVFESDAEAYEYFKFLAEYEYRQKKLVYNIRGAINNYTHRYDIRAGFKVVLLEKKYTL